LEQVCSQFEAVLLQSLWPARGLRSTFADDENDLSGAALGAVATLDGIFAEAFAAALEHAGGLGLGSELARKLSGWAR
ncbi:MAG: hypothetical protein M3007_02480, partial [Candidatus Eremiobacteraeota bacterium]|nr:hypothetical protein [Candidatus Eremiobacteraeota bacterium]